MTAVPPLEASPPVEVTPPLDTAPRRREGNPPIALLFLRPLVGGLFPSWAPLVASVVSTRRDRNDDPDGTQEAYDPTHA
ncbi:MAG TPA: hypothetical protein VHC69_19355 [Polyangiaceae bacterium]|nr:hypothetical protein [Polyangiaceae bacterium]